MERQLETISDLRRVPLTVYVGSPDHILFDGQAFSVTTHNDKGTLDVLPAHENFITIIKNGLVIVTPEGVKQEIKLDVGVMHVNENKVEIFTGLREVDLHIDHEMQPTPWMDKLRGKK